MSWAIHSDCVSQIRAQDAGVYNIKKFQSTDILSQKEHVVYWHLL